MYKSEEQETLESLVEWLSGAWKFASGQRKYGDATAAADLQTRCRPLFQKAHELGVSLQMRRDVPIEWAARATEAEFLAKIASPAIVGAANECADGKRNVLFLGKTGVGKTTGVVLLARKFYERQPRSWDHSHGYVFRRVHWTLARDLSNAVLAHPLGKGPCEAVSWAQGAAVLVLDDLGLERDHGPLLDVLEARYERSLPTWTTSGLTVSQIADRYGEAFYRRLVEIGGTAGKVVAAFGKPTKAVAA